MNQPIPTTKDIAYLRSNPEKAELFDKRFGEGTAAEALSRAESAGAPQGSPSGLPRGQPATNPEGQPGGASVVSPQPTPKDVEYLRAHPELAEKFDARFGEGASASILPPAPVVPETVTAEGTPEVAPGSDLVQALQAQGKVPLEEADRSVMGEIATSIGHGVQEAFNETVDALESFDIAASQKLDEWGIPSRLQIIDKDGQFDPRLKMYHESLEDPDMLGGLVGVKGDAVELDVAREPVTAYGRFTSTTSQFLAGMLGAGRLTGLKGLTGAVVNGAIADGVVFDPDDPNLVAWAEQNEYAIPILTEALATDPDDPEWMNRMRNVTEGVVLGVVADTLLVGLKGFAKVVRGKRAGGDAGEAMIREGQEMVDAAASEAQDVMENGVRVDGAGPEFPSFEEWLKTQPDAPRVLTPEERVDLPEPPSLEPPEVPRPAEPEVRADVDAEPARPASDPEPTRVDEEGTASKPEGEPEGTAEVTPEAAAREALANPEAIRAALAGKDLVTPDQIADSLWFNASKMDGPMEAQAMIEVAGDALARSGALERMGLGVPETFESVVRAAKQELADLTGGSLDDLTARVAVVGENAAEQGKFLIAGKMALQSVGREVAQVAAKLDGMYALGKIDPEVEARLLDLMTTHTDLQGHLKRVQTAAARAVSLGRVRTTDGIDSAAMDALTRVEAAGGSKAIRKAAQKLRLASGPAQQAELLRQMARGGIGNRAIKVANEVFVNSILSGWRTHAINVTSNMVNTVVLPMERIMGGALTRNRNQMREGFEQYVALRSAVMDSVRLSAKVLRTEMPVLDNQVKLDYQREGYRAISKEALGVQSQHGGAIVDGIGSFLRLPGRFLMAEDEFFKQVMFRSRLKARLTVEAQAMTPEELKRLGYESAGEFIESETRAATLSIQNLEDRWDTLVAQGKVVDDPEVKTQFIQDNLGAANEGSRFGADALRVAREATFTEPLTPGSLSHSYQNIANRHPILRQITPFIQTPMNILGKSFDRVPGVNMIRRKYWDRINSSDPRVKAEAMGEMATGVALSTTLLMLAYEGRITGGGPLDGKTREMWTRDKNWQPYSINLGTAEEPHWVEYRRMDPYSFTFGIAADMAEMIQASENNPAMDSSGMFAMLIASAGQNLTSKTWLQGISDVVEVLHSGDRPQIAQRFLEQRMASIVPFSSAGRTANQGQDPFMREARGFADRIKANIPGMSGELPVRFDWVSGEPVENPSYLLGFLREREGDGDLVSLELRRLNFGFTGPDRKIGKITLSSEQFQDWAKLMGTVKIGGRTLKETLAHAMDTKAYDLDRERIPDGLSSPGESHRVQMLRGIIAGFKQKARGELFGLHPELQDAWVAYERWEADVLRGQASEGDRENLLLKF